MSLAELTEEIAIELSCDRYLTMAWNINNRVFITENGQDKGKVIALYDVQLGDTVDYVFEMLKRELDKYYDMQGDMLERERLGYEHDSVTQGYAMDRLTC
ncbi:hypothetical protein [Dyadobacter sandarakinus]|uniref:Uncharacterized protein n=1 Tax=Dyadobacter sandarakinus TaxID=2747268 RepID=A0ABX7I1V5_9BACT|nr:hypothetical protein [Dyadobacter sandarakinus]QRQ99754.1 hypothetical protein HWI92_01880 [Dyadobacter sandarakinus]